MPIQCLGPPNQVVVKKGGLSRVALRTHAIRYPGPPDQVVGEERWAEPGSLEDSCPSYAQVCPTKMEVQKCWAKPGSLEDSYPSDTQARPTKS
jgi:hypothetical protein